MFETQVQTAMTETSERMSFICGLCQNFPLFYKNKLKIQAFQISNHLKINKLSNFGK